MATTPASLFEDLERVLTEFKTFLSDDTRYNAIKAVIQTLGSVVPQVNQLIGQLVTVLTKLKEEIGKLDTNLVSPTQLGQATEFSNSARTLLETAKTLLPAQAAAIDQVLDALNVFGSLPSLGEFKGKILELLSFVITKVEGLQA